MTTENYTKTVNLSAQVDLDDVHLGLRLIEGSGLCSQLRLDLDADGRIDTRVATVRVADVLTVEERAVFVPALKKLAIACVADLGLIKE